MKALISSIEMVEAGYRVSQVEPDENVFAVAEGLFWVDCSDNVVADRYWYDPETETIREVPAPKQRVIPVTDTGENNA